MRGGARRMWQVARVQLDGPEPAAHAAGQGGAHGGAVHAAQLGRARLARVLLARALPAVPGAHRGGAYHGSAVPHLDPLLKARKQVPVRCLRFLVAIAVVLGGD